MAELKRDQADYFGTFLEKIQSQESTGELNDGLSKLLLQLGQAGAQPIPELQKATKLGFDEFNNELQAARLSGFVEVTGPKTAEQVELTERGRILLTRLARS